MALPLQTQVFVDGQWVTRTIDTHTLLQHHNRMEDMTVDNTMETIRPPVRGILTQTIIQSPLVHWILPIRLRGQEYNDVAFIGVSKHPFVHHAFRLLGWLSLLHDSFAMQEELIDSRLALSLYLEYT